MRYILLNKPYEVLTQFTDENGRQTLKDFVDVPNIYPVGRLDYDSEGLVLLTDDKQLQHRLSEPRFKVPKTYWVQVEGIPTEEALATLRRGVDLKSGFTSPAEAELLPDTPQLWERSKPVRFRATIPTSWVQIRISQGMNRQVRKMTAAVGFPTLRLVRVRIADLDVHNLQPGQWRELTEKEVKALTDDMAAQTAAAGTFKTPGKSAEYWPGGVRPASANAASGSASGKASSTASKHPQRAIGNQGTGRATSSRVTSGKSNSKPTSGSTGRTAGTKPKGQSSAPASGRPGSNSRKPGPAGGNRSGRR